MSLKPPPGQIPKPCRRELKSRSAGKGTVNFTTLAWRDPAEAMGWPFLSPGPTHPLAIPAQGGKPCERSAGRFRCPRGNVPVTCRAPHYWNRLLRLLLKFVSSHILAQSSKASFQEESMEPPDFTFLLCCLFKKQSSKIKISSSGKENLIQTFLRIDSTTFSLQTK